MNEHHEEESAIRRRKMAAMTPRERIRRRTTLHRLLNRTTRMRHSDLERDQPFSYLHCAISIVSYILMLSDVLRTGLGVHNLAPTYGFHEPDHLVFFGPYAYPVVTELFANETINTMRYWPYKYDTTSAVMRATVQVLKVDAWSGCVLYHEKCDEHGGLPLHSVFGMLDSVVEAVKQYKGIRPSTSVRSGHLSMRFDYAYYDRLHHYAFPWFFFRPMRRSGQAIHYKMQDLEARPICSYTSPRPNGCGEVWTNFARMCAREKNPLCEDSHNIWSHITSRMRTLRDKYANYTVDMVVFEGMDDFVRQGLTFQGLKFYDIVTITRIRRCESQDAKTCTIVAVDDYRYEAATLALNAPDWYGVSATIRGFGQLYAWARLVCLFVGCYVARSSETRMIKSSFFGKVRTTVRTVFMVPSQVMIYGSLVPIVCYVAAHLIDAAAVYELMGQQFISLMGTIKLDFKELMRVCAVSMRSVWLLAIVCHGLHWVSTHCVWSPLHGVLGVPEFVVSFVASLTVLAQLRFISFRNSKVCQVEETMPSHTISYWHSSHFDSSHSFLHRLFFGTEIDYKCLAASFLLHFALVAIVRVGNRVLPVLFKYQLLLISRTLVPYSAGAFWPSNALVVSWHGAFMRKPLKKRSRQSSNRTEANSMNPKWHLLNPFVEPTKRPHQIRVRPQTTPAFIDEETQERDMHSLDKRTQEIDSSIYLMNLGVMTDPFTYLRLRMFGGRLVGVYETKQTKRCVMLPYKMTSSTADIPINWKELELQFVMNTKDLDWWDLLQCG